MYLKLFPAFISGPSLPAYMVLESYSLWYTVRVEPGQGKCDAKVMVTHSFFPLLNS